MSPDSPSFFPPGVFTNMEFAVLTREVSKVACMACKKYISFMGGEHVVSANYVLSVNTCGS